MTERARHSAAPVEDGMADTVSKADLRQLAIDLAAQLAASESRLQRTVSESGARIEDWLETLNGKTVTHGEAIARQDVRITNVEKEVFERPRRRSVDLEDAPVPRQSEPPPIEWKQVAICVAAIGGAIWAGVELLFRFRELLVRLGVK